MHSPDHLLVTHDLYDPENPVVKHGRRRTQLEGWRLSLTALSAEDPERLVRFLPGAIRACGGWILTRAIQPDPSAEIEFEFARAACIEIYALLLSAGLELSGDSHLQLANLCHCTRGLIESRAFEIARVDLVIFASASADEGDGFSLPLAA